MIKRTVRIVAASEPAALSVRIAGVDGDKEGKVHSRVVVYSMYSH